MANTYTQFFLFSLVLLVFNACYAPKPLVRISPDQEENVFWHQGQAIAESRQDDIVARAAFSHFHGDYALFDVELINESEHTFLLDPKDLSITSDKGTRIPAIDPEMNIFSMQMEASRQEARRKNNAIIAGAVAVTAVVAVAVATSDDSPSSAQTDNNARSIEQSYNTVDLAVDVLSPAVALAIDFRRGELLSHEAAALPSTNTLEFWENIALRKTTLRPGDVVRGLVGFHKHASKNLLLKIPAHTTEFEFLFQQQVYQP